MIVVLKNMTAHILISMRAEPEAEANSDPHMSTDRLQKVGGNLPGPRSKHARTYNSRTRSSNRYFKLFSIYRTVPERIDCQTGIDGQRTISRVFKYIYSTLF